MKPGEPVTVLMVEDNPGDARLIRTLLDRTALKPLHLTAVDRVSRAVELLTANGANGKVDVVLLDVCLPDTRAASLDSLTRIKAAAPDLPVILLTGVDDEDFAVRAVREGAQDYLVKREIDAGLLGRSIRYAIERNRAEMALRDSEERYALALDGAKDGLWDWDLEVDARIPERGDRGRSLGVVRPRASRRPAAGESGALGPPRRPDAGLRERAPDAPPRRRLAVGAHPRAGGA